MHFMCVTSLYVYMFKCISVAVIKSTDLKSFSLVRSVIKSTDLKSFSLVSLLFYLN